MDASYGDVAVKALGVPLSLSFPQDFDTLGEDLGVGLSHLAI